MKRRSVPGKGAEEKRAWAGISGGKEFNILLKEPGRMQTPESREDSAQHPQPQLGTICK